MTACIAEAESLRYTPAGLPAINLRLEHESQQAEAGHPRAVKAAIKAGWQTEPEELLRLADAVCAGEVKYCPHGRPVAVTLTRRELDKLFKRIV